MESFSSLDRHTNLAKLGVNSLVTAGYHYTLGSFGWRYTPGSSLMISTRGAWMREKFSNNNPSSLPLGAGYYGEWVGATSATWMWNRRNPLDIGVSVRRLRDTGFYNQYQSTAATPRLLDRFSGTATRAGGYAQQGWTAWSGRLRLAGSARWDRHSIVRGAAVSPQASAAFLLTHATQLVLGWGQYVQYPELSLLTSPLGAEGLLPMRSNHATAAVEQRLGERTRIRLELYNRTDRDLPFQPLYDPRLIDGKLFIPPLNAPYRNSLRGYARGVELFLQRSSANRFTGWVSYAYGHTGMRDGGEPAGSNNRFPSAFDQRHTFNFYGGYRLKPTINLSVQLEPWKRLPDSRLSAKKRLALLFDRREKSTTAAVILAARFAHKQVVDPRQMEAHSVRRGGQSDQSHELSLREL